MDIGFMYGYSHQIALSINYNMLFSALNLLVSIKPSVRIHMVRCLDTTGINDAKTGALLTTGLCANL